MRKDIADVVYPVLSYALRVKDQLARGEAISWETAQASLKGMLQTQDAARRWGDFGADPSMSVGRAQDTFLGIRYALVCWLDEIFVLDSPWSAQWNEQKLEAELYGTNDRAWKFWEQARRAESRLEKDALEVFFWCVMLGFGGELRQQPDKLQAWVT